MKIKKRWIILMAAMTVIAVAVSAGLDPEYN